MAKHLASTVKTAFQGAKAIARRRTAARHARAIRMLLRGRIHAHQQSCGPPQPGLGLYLILKPEGVQDPVLILLSYRAPVAIENTGDPADSAFHRARAKS